MGLQGVERQRQQLQLALDAKGMDLMCLRYGVNGSDISSSRRFGQADYKTVPIISFVELPMGDAFLLMILCTSSNLQGLYR